jgi:non-homologous end joining protein Ku
VFSCYQLQSGDAVREASELEVELLVLLGQELQLAVQLVKQSSAERFEPMDYIDPAKQRIQDAARRKLSAVRCGDLPLQVLAEHRDPVPLRLNLARSADDAAILLRDEP